MQSEEGERLLQELARLKQSKAIQKKAIQRLRKSNARVSRDIQVMEATEGDVQELIAEELKWEQKLVELRKEHQAFAVEASDLDAEYEHLKKTAALFEEAESPPAPTPNFRRAARRLLPPSNGSFSSFDTSDILGNHSDKSADRASTGRRPSGDNSSQQSGGSKWRNRRPSGDHVNQKPLARRPSGDSSSQHSGGSRWRTRRPSGDHVQQSNHTKSLVRSPSGDSQNSGGGKSRARRPSGDNVSQQSSVLSRFRGRRPSDDNMTSQSLSAAEARRPSDDTAIQTPGKSLAGFVKRKFSRRHSMNSATT